MPSEAHTLQEHTAAAGWRDQLLRLGHILNMELMLPAPLEHVGVLGALIKAVRSQLWSELS